MSKAERTKQFIIERAAPLLNSKGIAGTAVSDIMAATSLAKGGVYGNFESKEALCTEAFVYLIARIDKSINARLNKEATAKGKLNALLDFYGDQLLSANDGGCPLLNFGTESDDTNPVIKAKVIQATQEFMSRFSKLVKAGQQAGQFSKNINAAHFGLKAFSMIEGALFMTKLHSNAKYLRQIIAMLKEDLNEASI